MKKLSILTTLLFALGLYMVPATFATGASTDSKDKRSVQGEYQKDQKGQSQAQQAQQGQQFQQQKQNLVLVENLSGAEVRNQQGENIGEIDKVLVDVGTGQVGFVTMNSGGVLGVGEDKYIVPFNALKTETLQRTEGALGMSQLRFTLNTSKEQLKKVPEGDIEQALTQESQNREIHEYYGVSPYWEGGQRQQNDNQRPMMDDARKGQMMDKMDNKDQQKNEKKY